MAEVIRLGTRPNGAWMEVAYDLQIRYGYETMLRLLDRFIADYQARVDRVDKATIAGMAYTTVWRRIIFKMAKPLTEMESLKEECGVVAIGCTVKVFDGLQMYLTMMNQTSVVTIQVPEDVFSDEVQSRIDSIAQFFNATLSDY